MQIFTYLLQKNKINKLKHPIKQKKATAFCRSSRRELRQLNKSLRICDIRLTTSDIAFRQLYSPDGELRIYLI